MDVEIISYEKKYLKEATSLFLELMKFEHTLDSDKAANMDSAKEYMEDILNTLKESRGRLYLAKSEGNIVGLLVWFEEKEIEFSISYAYISDVVVSEKYRGKGIGKLLLNKAIDDISKTDIKRIHIGVLAENIGALSLYRKMGFEDSNVELVMHKR